MGCIALFVFLTSVFTDVRSTLISLFIFILLFFPLSISPARLTSFWTSAASSLIIPCILAVLVTVFASVLASGVPAGTGFPADCFVFLTRLPRRIFATVVSSFLSSIFPCVLPTRFWPFP